MRNTTLFFLCIFFCPAVFCQQVINLYDGPVPDAKKNEGAKNTTMETAIGKIVLIVVNLHYLFICHRRRKQAVLQLLFVQVAQG
jgi:hypothetical protein